ncbi:MAG: hypothetical protein KY462_01200 [Actinobacteria bacterium]|nr:hypothetical protein [Actinomycetota bacterium]
MPQDELHRRVGIALGNLVALLRGKPACGASQQTALIRDLRRRVIVRAAVHGGLDHELLATWEVIDAISRCSRLIAELTAHDPQASRHTDLARRLERLMPAAVEIRTRPPERPTGTDVRAVPVTQGLVSAIVQDLDRELDDLERSLVDDRAHMDRIHPPRPRSH